MNPTELNNYLKRLRFAKCKDLIEEESDLICLRIPGPYERTEFEIICHELIQLGRELEKNSSFTVALAASPKEGKKKK